MLAHAPTEVPALLAALREGRIEGGVYAGECRCLVGTLAQARGCEYTQLDGIDPNPDRPAERWFLALSPGDTPANNQISAITAGWVESWLDARG